MDSDTPRQSVIELLLRHASSGTESAQDALRKELSALRLKELRRRAKAAGCSVDAIDDAVDCDDPKAALIEMVLAAEEGSADE